MPEKKSDLIHVLNSQTVENCQARMDHEISVLKAYLKSFLLSHIVASKKFLRTSSSPHETLPNDKYDAPKEVCGERKLFYRPLKT